MKIPLLFFQNQTWSTKGTKGHEKGSVLSCPFVPFVDIPSEQRPFFPSSRRRGFMLLEALLAVTIFALGVLTLGRCVSQCVAAERLKEEDALARRLLENRWAEIEAGTGTLPTESSEEFDETSPFHALKLRLTSVPIVKKNEKEEKIEGLFAVTMTATWQSDGEEQSKELMFYVYPRPRQ